MTTQTFDIHALLGHVQRHGGGIFNVNDGWGSTMLLNCLGHELFEYEDIGTELCEKTAEELIAMYPDVIFTPEINP